MACIMALMEIARLLQKYTCATIQLLISNALHHAKHGIIQSTKTALCWWLRAQMANCLGLMTSLPIDGTFDTCLYSYFTACSLIWMYSKGRVNNEPISLELGLPVALCQGTCDAEHILW